VTKEEEQGKEHLKNNPIILITGANGLVGSRFCELAVPDYKSLFSTDIEDFNINNKEAIKRWVKKEKPEVLINFAALTDVNEIEKERPEGEKSKAFVVNAVGPRNLAEVCRENKIFLIHISTDFVFPGIVSNIGPYSEDAQTAQGSEEISWYGWTKLMGEKAIQEIGGDFAIVRISYLFALHLKNLILPVAFFIGMTRANFIQCLLINRLPQPLLMNLPRFLKRFRKIGFLVSIMLPVKN